MKKENSRKNAAFAEKVAQKLGMEPLTIQMVDDDGVVIDVIDGRWSGITHWTSATLH